RLQQADHWVSASGTFALRGPQNLQLQIARFPLADLKTLLGTGPEISGALNTELRVQGTAAAPELALDVSTGAVTVAGQTVAGQTLAAASARLAYHQQQLQVNALLRQDATHTLSVDGGVPLSLQWEGKPSAPVLGAADLRVRSNGLSLAFVNSLMPNAAIEDV